MSNTLLCRRWRGSDFPDALFASMEPSIRLDRCWDGRPSSEAVPVWCAWNPECLFFEFACPFADLNVSQEWASDTPAHGLWQRDVVEVFVRPSLDATYFEFEISPLGQWLDVMIRSPRVDVDFAWSSGMKVQSLIDACRRVWTARLTIPVASMARALNTPLQPAVGNAWKGNLFRISGTDPEREFVAWQPTLTLLPDFHVPAAFGNWMFVE